MSMINKNIKDLSTEEKINLVRSTYNDIAERYVEAFYEDFEDNKYLDKFLNSLSGQKILDAGCGIGRECKYVQEKGFDAIGVDFAEEIIKEAKRKYPEGNFKVMDVTNLSFADESFDGIIFMNTIFHLPKEQIDTTLSAFSNMLKKDGKMLIILQEGNEEKLVEEPLKEGSCMYMQHYSFEFIESKLKEHNLKIYDYEREIANNKNCPIDKKLILYVSKQ